MTYEELKKLDPESVMFVDIRSDEEVAGMPNLPGSVHIPMNDMIEKANANELPKDKKIISICRSGARSAMMTQFLQELEYDAEAIDQGMEDLMRDQKEQQNS